MTYEAVIFICETGSLKGNRGEKGGRSPVCHMLVQTDTIKKVVEFNLNLNAAAFSAGLVSKDPSRGESNELNAVVGGKK